MQVVNKICPRCHNANYVRYLGELSDLYKYKCINCNAYLNDEDFEKPALNNLENIKEIIEAVEDAFDLIHSDFIGTKDFNEGEWKQLRQAAIELLKKQELHELTKNEWEQWKNNPRRDPICMLWYKDTTPMWILTPVEVHEPAYLMGKIKLFNRKPTIEEIQGVKWND